jgi:hypothetical protein
MKRFTKALAALGVAAGAIISSMSAHAQSVNVNADLGSGLIPVRISGEQSDDPLAMSDDMKFQAAARPGRTIKVDYPVALVSEVQVRAVKSGATAKAQGVSALRLRLVSSSGKTFTEATAYDGVADFANLSPGEYRLEIDKDQAEHLGVRLVSSVLIVAPPEGGVLSPVDVQVTFESSEDASR